MRLPEKKKQVTERFSFISNHPYLLAGVLIFIFFLLYSVLSVVRHNNYQSFGHDLGINDQVVWHYSRLQAPITTSDPFPTQTKLAAHVELVYVFIAPFYWIWSDARMLLLVEVFFITSSGFALFLLARRKKLRLSVSLALLLCYLAFYGVQNALWFDVHSATFAAAFLAWFVYFLDAKKVLAAILFGILAITAKENIGLIVFLIGLVYFFKRRDRLALSFMVMSLLYVAFIYFIYFPHIIQQTYLYQNEDGLLSNISPISFIDTHEKREAIFYSLFSFGMLPLLTPLMLLPALGDLATYFVIASDLTGSHGVFMHYRVTLAPLLVLATIMAITHFPRLNSRLVGFYLVACILIVQYLLHLPLSYLTKSWFWNEPSGVKNINALIPAVSSQASVVAQNNILPHLSQREKIYTLYPEKKEFLKDSPCGERTCSWFRWVDDADYLIVDTSEEWDIRHLLANKEEYHDALSNIEKAGIVKLKKREGTAVLYKIISSPEF